MIDNAQLLNDLRAARPLLWAGRTEESASPPGDVGAADVAATVARLQRFAPLLAILFPQLQVSGGQIESELVAPAGLQQALGLPSDQGTLLVKADHALPVAGSIKARGGIHEVLEHAETLARRHGLLDGGDYRALASDQARAMFARHQVAVGSTGNLGLAIGVMASALGMRAVVHMSRDAKEWKKSRLRRRGVEVIEHAGDYEQAVAAGRRAAEADPLCHFVDDEQSASLFLGYAAAAPHLATQLASAARRVDAQHPLFVYLPCGVGGAPGGIAFGLQQIYGRHAHCFFAEPTRSPCFLIEMLAATGATPAPLGAHPSVYDFGLDNRTEADGLAVPRASELAAAAVRGFIGGVYTVADDTLLRHLHRAQTTAGLRVEPSAAAAFAGPQMLLGTHAGRDYLQRQRLLPHLAQSTHIAWTTGGLFVPDDEYERFLARGAALDSVGMASSSGAGPGDGAAVAGAASLRRGG